MLKWEQISAVFSYLELHDINEIVAQDITIPFHSHPCCNSQVNSWHVWGCPFEYLARCHYLVIVWPSVKYHVL